MRPFRIVPRAEAVDRVTRSARCNGRFKLVGAIRMKAVLSARSRSHRGAPGSVLYGLFALVVIGASTAVAQSRPELVQRLGSIAGAGVRENRSVGIIAAVVKGNDTLLLEAYGKAVV